ncbi:hypothetical protein FRC03_011687 [Tulasnella sp. 419]|nr:hypothetical protein FRC03_011687 [Tulasnella sp. 419]
MAPLKVAFYSSKHYDVDSFTEGEQRLGTLEENPISFHFLEPRLQKNTVPLARDHDAVCIFVNDVADAEVLEGLANLGVKILALRVDLKKAQELGITVVSVPAYSPDAVAEFAIGMILTVVRKYHKAYNRVREGNFLLDGLLGFNIRQSTVGLIGTGKIGLLAGKILSHGFGAKVIAYDPYPNEAAAKEYGISYVPTLNELLNQSDIITLHCPLTPSTRYIINEEAIKQMKQDVVIVNTSRGALIDTAALIKGLKEGKIKAVGLDVYEKEREYFFEDRSSAVMQDDLLARLLSFNNVFVSGHQAFLTTQALEGIADTTIDNLLKVGQGLECKNIVKG